VIPALRPVLGDQLSDSLPSLADADKARDVVLMAEVADEAAYVPHHKKKIAFLFAAMRAHAGRLRAAGFRVDYVRLDDPANTGSLTGEVARAAKRHASARIVATEPGEYRVRADMETWGGKTGLPVEIRDDTRFICSRAGFAAWAKGRKELRMEFFYREMRRKTGVLMDKNGEPEGGRWNFDAENRKRLPAGHVPPPRGAFGFPPDPETRAVLDLVRARFPDNFGDLEPFGFATTKDQAETAFAEFLRVGLPGFGDYQDAMKTGQPFLYHSLISAYLNAGLLDARDLCARAETEYRAGRAPLNAVEGFVRQILGWREFVRGLYWLDMPGYRETNFLDARRPLPALYWTAGTKMNCLAQCVAETRANAYAHHIQRLMVLGNFALLAGVAPREIQDWFLAVYADAYEWVELPNVHGMAIHADGGRLGSKPYAASGAYIDRMSDYCRGCAFDPKIKSGPRACPFNPLYWDFLMRNERRLARNPRMAMPYRTLAAMTPARKDEIARDAAAILAAIP
jgi:deoxyribodipyrimidine photolyase-related protein